MQTNLYKCFMPLAWGLNGTQGVAGLLHPEGPYDDPKGGNLREAVMRGCGGILICERAAVVC